MKAGQIWVVFLGHSKRHLPACLRCLLSSREHDSMAIKWLLFFLVVALVWNVLFFLNGKNSVFSQDLLFKTPEPYILKLKRN